MLPLGLRVQEKLEKLIDKHMASIDASKVSLSSISSQTLWQKSGRLKTGSELFKFTDRKDARWLLAPTHEEEITSLVSDVVQSSKQLPIRLYQISRKYRDERRPRGGLLRGREFIMKDLYTFDADPVEAHVTYDSVRRAYRNFLDELNISYIEARADSGNMGGSLSHEYHFPSTSGEDDVISCVACDYARNEEWVPDCAFKVEEISLDELHARKLPEESPSFTTTEIIDTTHTCLVKVFAPVKMAGQTPVGINEYAVKAALDGILELDTGVERVRQAFETRTSSLEPSKTGTVFYLLDPSISSEQARDRISLDMGWLTEKKLKAKIVTATPENNKTFTLLKQVAGDTCPQCQTGTLKVDKAIEVGHTFHLGTRYSSKLGPMIKSADQPGKLVPVEMGCHGIGVSRLVAAVASSLSDETGLNWPRAIAPFEAVIIVDGNDEEKSDVAKTVYDQLTTGQEDGVDVLLDDRTTVNSGYKLKDADLIGYPVILVVGRLWKQTQQIEVQCRRLGVTEKGSLDEVAQRVKTLLSQL